MQHGTAAHGAGLQRHIQRAALKPVIAQSPSRFAQGQHLGMGRWVLGRERAVMTAAYDLPVLDDHSPHRHLATGGGAARLLQRLVHEVLVHGSIKIHSYMHLTDKGLTDIPSRNTDTAQ